MAGLQKYAAFYVEASGASCVVAETVTGGTWAGLLLAEGFV